MRDICAHAFSDSETPEFMQVKFWGVRGSTPTPQAENLRYGGNTS